MVRHITDRQKKTASTTKRDAGSNTNKKDGSYPVYSFTIVTTLCGNGMSMFLSRKILSTSQLTALMAPFFTDGDAAQKVISKFKDESANSMKHGIKQGQKQELRISLIFCQ